MSDRDHRFVRQAADLRSAFDNSFSQPPRTGVELSEDFLSIRVGSDAYAVRLSTVSGLYSGRRITVLPNTASGCLGIAAFRRIVVPVFDLRVLLGYPAGPDIPGWLMIAQATPLALAFNALDGHLRMPIAAIAREGRVDNGPKHIHEALRTTQHVLPVIDVASILEAIRKSAHDSVLHKER